MKPIIRMFALLLLLLGTVKFADAQNGSVYFGLGSAYDSSTSNISNPFTGTVSNGPTLGGVFVNLGGDLMFKPKLGFGAEFSFRGDQGGYVGLNYRPLFYDFNAYYPQSYCDQFAGCSSSNSYLESSHHFQLHFGAGVRLYVKGGLFVRPQVDVHWVNNFFQFGSNWVPEYSASVGYTFGRNP